MREAPHQNPWRALAGGILRAAGTPRRRLCGLPRNDEGQVMVLTAVMVFIVALATISSLNTSELLFNRIRTQNAVDAAADAFALWQARGFNVNQHINDIHYEYQIAFYARTLLTCTKRFVNLGLPNSACQQRFCQPRCSGCRRVCKDHGLPAVKNCCRAVNNELSRIEREQATMSNLLLFLQGVVDVVAPQMGWLAASEVAKGSGADALENPALKQEIVTTLASLGVTGYDIDAVMNSELAPRSPIHAVPLRVPLLEMLPAPTKTGLTALPPWSAGGPSGGRCLFPGFQDIACMLSTCGDNGALWCVFGWPLVRGFLPGFIRNLIGPSDGCSTCFDFIPPIPGFCSTAKPPCISFYFDSFCQFPLRDLNECDYGCTGAVVDRVSTAPGQLCGWHDTFFIGSPLAYTWVTAKDQRNLGNSAIYENLRWFNPRFGTGVQGRFETMEEDLTYLTSDDYAFDRSGNLVASGDFRNARFMTLASCTARGNQDLLLQPLTMYSGFLRGAGFEYTRPHLINVHLDPLGVSDDSADENIIWH